MDSRIRNVTHMIVQLLVSGNYAQLEQETKGRRLSAKQIQRAVEEYGPHLRMPPDEIFNSLDAIEVTGAASGTWSVRCDLWTQEEGPSDLSLELTVIDQGESLQVEIDNIHVL